jgi:hypothetical protein
MINIIDHQSLAISSLMVVIFRVKEMESRPARLCQERQLELEAKIEATLAASGRDFLKVCSFGTLGFCIWGVCDAWEMDEKMGNG